MAGIPVNRVIEKLDEYLNVDNDYQAGERHLKYWLAEAEYLQDESGAFTVLNEMIGMYRKAGNKNAALRSAEKVLALTEQLGIGETVSGATAYLNAATARKAFGDPEGALPLYRRAKEIYEAGLEAGDRRLAGLYNNMALTLTDLKEYNEADALFHKALAILEKLENTEPDRAVTYLNLAELEERAYGFDAAEEQILAYMDQAWEMLNREGLPRNGYYAFVAEKCIPLFERYEYYLIANELRRRIAEIRNKEWA